MPAEQTSDNEEFVVLQDTDGHYYLLPRQTVEAARIADESVDRLRALLGDEVTGHGLMPSQIGSGDFLSARGIIIVSGLTGLHASGIQFVPSQTKVIIGQ